MLLVTFVLTLTFLPAAMRLLVPSPSPVQACGARLGRYMHVAGVWHEICYPPPPPFFGCRNSLQIKDLRCLT